MAPVTGLPSKATGSAQVSPKKQVSGLPDYRDVHMDTAKSYNDIRMNTGRTLGEDIRMETARGAAATGGGSTIRNPKFKVWERELIDSPEVRRKATVAQLCE